MDRAFFRVSVRLTLVAWCGLLVWTVPGCSGKGSSGREQADDAEAADGNAAADAGGTPAPRTGKPKKPGKGKEPAHIGEIPKDVWPEVWLQDPLAVAAETGGAPPAATADAGPAKTQPDPATTPADTAKPAAPTGGSSGTDWAALITGEVLADESKAIRNRLTAQLQDAGRYNSTYKEARVEATVLTVLAAIAPNVPESPGWKTNAKYVRDVASTVAAESKANGDKYFKKAKEAFQKLESLLSGDKPDDSGEAADQVKFSEVADRRYLMLRMERIRNWMKSDVNSEAVFKKEAAKLTQEASVLAILAKVITAADYPDHDVDEYRSFADAVSQASHEIVGAVKDGEFKAYTTALENYNKACNKCHEVYK